MAYRISHSTYDIFRSQKGRDYGAYAAVDIDKGSYIISYIGVIRNKDRGMQSDYAIK